MQLTVTLAPTVTIRDVSFDPRSTDTSVLSLEVGRDRFQILVQDNRGRAIYLEDFMFPSLLNERTLVELLPDIFRGHVVLSAKTWQEIRIGINSSSFTLIPKELYRKEYADSYLTLMRGSALPVQESAQSYLHESEGFLSVFNLQHSLLDYFSEVYPLQPMTFVHQTSAIIRATADLNRHALTPNNVYLYFENEFVTILYRKDQQVRYCNRFGYKNVQDLAYYVFYVLDEQGLVADAVSISLFGEITPFAESYTELSRFLPKLSFGQIPPGMTLSGEFEDLPAHRYLSLYGLGLISD
ncbi:hypothetical protein GCM10028805_40420 [Spirosoma harenae]